MITKLLFILIISGLFHSSILFGQQDRLAELKKISTLEGKPFFDALDDYYFEFNYPNWHEPTVKDNITKYTLEDTLNVYWLAIRKITNSIPKNFEERYPASRMLENILYEMLSSSGETEYPKLLDYHSDMPDTSVFKDDSFLMPLCNYWIKKETDYLISNSIKPKDNLVLSKDFTPSPAINPLPAELKNSWYLFKSFESSYRYRINQDTSCQWYSVQKNYALFFKEIEEILKSESVGEHMKEILRYTWGGWCGTGSEYFYEKQQVAILILLLKERNYAAILGNLSFTDNLGFKKFRKLIQLCEFDWIDYYTGVMLDGKWWRTTPEFTRLGGVRAANKLLKMKEYDYENVYGNQQYLIICNKFINPEKQNESKYDIDWFSNSFFRDEFNTEKDSIIEVPSETKDKLRTTIIETVKGDTTIGICTQAIIVLSDFPFNHDIKEIMLGYTSSEFKSVRDGAAKILKKNGIDVELPKDNGLVVFRLFIDNALLSNFNVDYQIYTDSSKYGYSRSGSKTTSENGIISFSKDLLLSMKNPVQKIKFTSDGFSSDKQQHVFFCAGTKMPNDLSDTIDVFITTVKLNLRFDFNRSKEFYNNKEMRIYLSNNNCFLQSIELTNSIKDYYTLPQKIQKGNYYINISIPGSNDWYEFFEVNEDTTNLDINLEHGTNVLFKIKAPGGENADKQVQFELINNKNKNRYLFASYSYILDGYESLPVGFYTLKIISSKEKKEKTKINSLNNCNEITPDYIDYRGKDIEFSITSDSPETIDLGTIELEPTN